MRTLVDIPDAQVHRLDVRARRAGVSRASLIREAVDKLLGPNDILTLDEAFGMWGDKGEDGVDLQRRLRAEWDREWDPD